MSTLTLSSKPLTDDRRAVLHRRIRWIVAGTITYNVIEAAIALAAGYGLLHLIHPTQGYWILLTTLFVCQPNYGATRLKLVQRIAGTLLGLGIGWALFDLFPDPRIQALFAVVAGVAGAVAADVRQVGVLRADRGVDRLGVRAEANGLAGASYQEIVSSAQARDMVQSYVDELNKGLNKWERVGKFTILGRDLSVEDGELTPSLKLRRKVVSDKFKGEIDGMYAG